MAGPTCHVIQAQDKGKKGGVYLLVFEDSSPTWSGICEQLREGLRLESREDEVNKLVLHFIVPSRGPFKVYNEITLKYTLANFQGQTEVRCYFNDAGIAATTVDSERDYDLDEGLDELLLNKQKRLIDGIYYSQLAATTDSWIDIHDTVKRVGKAIAPSSAITTKHLASQQTKAPLFNGRPAGHHGPPISIYSSAFGLFEELMSEPTWGSSVPQSDFAAAPDFIRLLSDIYKEEDGRRIAINKKLAEVLGFTVDLGHDYGKTKPDGEVVVKINNPGGAPLHYPMCVLQYKPEVGSGSGDPSLQGGFATRKIVTSNSFIGVFNVCPCPVLVISIAGPHIMVSGFVFADIAMQQPLTNYVWFADTGEAQIEYTAKLFHALRETLKDLEAMYTSLQLSEKLDFHAKLPAYTSFKTSNGSTLTIKYISPVFQEEEQRRRPLFYAQALGGIESTSTRPKLVVKFPKRYSPEAHSLLAADNRAPKLYHFERIRGGRYVVIMDHIPGITAFEYVGDPPHRPLPNSALEDISSAINTLHSHPSKLVFGDLRLPNIMMIPAREVEARGPDATTIVEVPAEEGWRAMLFDFDWSGPEGHSRYPYNINMSGDVIWPNGVGPGTKMERGHDREMLKNLIPGQDVDVPMEER